MQEADARAQLAAKVQQSSEPTLSNAELQALLNAYRRVDVYGVYADRYASWVASTAYSVGDYVVPTTRNGHFYRVTVAGTGTSTEPTWPTTSGAAVTQDGITYVEAGAAPWLGTWALNEAAAEGWRWKAGKAAGRYSFGSDVNNFQRRQIHEMCLQMAEQYSKGGSTVCVAGSEAYDPVIGNLNGAV